MEGSILGLMEGSLLGFIEGRRVGRVGDRLVGTTVGDQVTGIRAGAGDDCSTTVRLRKLHDPGAIRRCHSPALPYSDAALHRD